MDLVRYWFEFDFQSYDDIPHGIGRGCGVTALGYDDALRLLQETLFKEMPVPKINRAIENVDISTLDAGHVLPNMEVATIRGIWFPRGYAC